MKATTFRLVPSDRAAICKGCKANIVWRVGLTRPLLLADGSEHVCAAFVKRSHFATGGRRRGFVPSAPDMTIPEGTIVKRGGKTKACETCGFDQLEWISVQQSNGYAKWFLVPFGTSDLSGSLHATRSEDCTLGDSAPAPAPQTGMNQNTRTRRAAAKPAPANAGCDSCGVADRVEGSTTCADCAKPAPVATSGLIITLDNGAIITISNVAKFDVVAN